MRRRIVQLRQKNKAKERLKLLEQAMREIEGKLYHNQDDPRIRETN
jgi:hypothetical protein